jgi:hypothetical protein
VALIIFIKLILWLKRDNEIPANGFNYIGKCPVYVHQKFSFGKSSENKKNTGQKDNTSPP